MDQCQCICRLKVSCDTKFLHLSLIFVLATSGFLLNQAPPVLSEEDTSHNTTKDFDLWTKFEKGYDSLSVQLGEPLQIRCRVSINNTELMDDDDLSAVKMTFFKDNVILPDYWSNKMEAELAQVTAHSKFSFEFAEAQDSHRGLYKCVATFGDQTEELEFLVRVKTNRLEIPAMIIGLQVVVLSFIYFIFDKRQKRLEAQLLGEQNEADEQADKNHRT